MQAGTMAGITWQRWNCPTPLPAGRSQVGTAQAGEREYSRTNLVAEQVIQAGMQVNFPGRQAGTVLQVPAWGSSKVVGRQAASQGCPHSMSQSAHT